jgi:hypothetical protein
MTAPIIRSPAVWGALCAWVLLGAVGLHSAQAQEVGRIAETKTNTAYFYYAQPGEATVQIYVWGAAQAGIYEIPVGTSLARLLTMTGGVGRDVREEGQEPPRITVRHYRPEQSREDPLLETRAQNILQGNVEAQQLQENDIVVVERVQPNPFTWQDALSILTTASSITLLVLRVLRFQN